MYSLSPMITSNPQTLFAASALLGFTEIDRVENIRRIGEVAKLMLDAGLIVITADACAGMVLAQLENRGRLRCSPNGQT